MLVDARGWGALPWTHERFLPVQRTGCSWMLVDAPTRARKRATKKLRADAVGAAATARKVAPGRRADAEKVAPS